MRSAVLQALGVLLLCSSVVIGRSLLAECPHATSSLFNCAPVNGTAVNRTAANGTAANFVVCLNICPSPADSCAPCSNPAQTCSSVDATRSGLAPREFNATLNTYQYGDICFAATPPAGQVGKENSNPGLPAVSDPESGHGPTPSYTGTAPNLPPAG